MESHHTQGFTLIELMTALAVAGILLAIGVPSFSAAIKESRISSQYGAMVGSLYLARSEAIKGPGQVTVCPKNAIGANACGDKNDWANGWIVFIDNTTISGETTASIDSGDEIISQERALSSNNTIKALSSTNNTAADAEDVAFVRYLQDGGTLRNTGSVVICDTSRGASSSRVINIVLTGDIRRGRVATGSDAPRDVFDRPISIHCTEPSS